MRNDHKSTRTGWLSQRGEAARGRAARRTAAATAAFALVATTTVIATSTVVDIATAPPARADFADGGEGRFLGGVDWINWGTDGTPITAGESRTSTRTIGGNTISTTCTITSVSGDSLIAYRPGDYVGDAFDDLYNIGGTGTSNQLIAGLANETITPGGQTTFDFTCASNIDGFPIELAGLMVADAESSNTGNPNREDEFITAVPTQDATWRIVDRYRGEGCTTAVQATLAGSTLTLAPDARECNVVNQTPGPIAVGFMEGATSATVTLQGGGRSAVALGAVALADFGDAPESYGPAGALAAPDWSGGDLPQGTTDVSTEGFALGAPTAPEIRLGESVDPESGYLASPDATGDDADASLGFNDEDGVTPPDVIDTAPGEEYSLDVVCAGDAFVAGWIDWEADGAFGGNRSDVVPCAGGSATLTWTVPDDAVESLDAPTFMRLRIAPGVAGAGQPTLISPGGGEVEDYAVNVDVPVPELTITKTAEPSSVVAGETVDYTVTVENSGEVDYTADAPATFTDDLTEVLDDATYNDDAAADVGTTDYAEPELSWSGPLPIGETATVTYSVTVDDPVAGDSVLTNSVVGPEESNCDDGTEEGCTTDVPVRDLEIVKTSDPADEALAGGTVEYTVEVTNTGQYAYTADDPATVTDDLSEVLDDATYNDDAAASVGEATFSDPELSWSGPLAPGETATITYTVTVNDPLTGDGELVNSVTGPPESNCLDGTEEDCTTVVPVRALAIVKSSDGSGESIPGDVVTYTVTVENTGQVPYTEADPAEITDDLTEVLDDATYNDDASADAGEVTYADPVLSWSGELAPGDTATVTYSVTVNDPPTGDGVMENVVLGPDESNCTDPGSLDPDCVEPNPIKDLEITKTVDPADEVLPGGTVEYTITVENTGQVPYTADDPATLTDELTEVLDDAVYNDDAAADVGEVTYGEPTLSWNGPLEPGDVATITYTVTVNDPLSGDGTLTNAVVGPPESSCDDGTEPGCTTDVPVRALEIVKTSSHPIAVVPGETVEYTVEVTNSGQVAYTDADPAVVTDDLSSVVDDATWDDTATADVGEVTFADPTLTWTGPLEPGQTATITYSVTVDDPPTGDGTLDNAVTGPPESNCDDGTEEDCFTSAPIRELLIEKSADVAQAMPGDVVTYTVEVTNTGEFPFGEVLPARFDDDLTDVLDDAVYNDDASADVGETTYEEPTLHWESPLGVGETATITYSVTVNDPVSGDGDLDNTVSGPPVSNCFPLDDDPPFPAPECQVVVPIQALAITKTAEPSEVMAGGEVDYTVTVENTGQVPYTDDAPATFTDDLTGVTDDAEYNGDAEADIGAVTGDGDPELTWSGPLEPGDVATVTYSVTVADPLTEDGDRVLDNSVTGPEESNCDTGDEDGCHVPVPVRDLTITKTADPVDQVDAGSTVTYTVTVENTGGADYTADDPASFTDDLTAVLDDATYDDDASADVGEVTYAEPELAWSGPLPAGETATVTYSVTVNNPVSGDGTLTNAVVGPEESNCLPDDEGELPEECATDVPVRALFLEKTSDGAAGARPGDTITYTVTATNTGQVPYTDADPATFDDDLTEVLDDAVFNDDATADVGTVSFAEPILSWAGPLEPGEVATITYSVTLNDPPTGDENVFNVVLGPGESNCTDPESDDPDCIEPDPVKDLEILKTADPEGAVTVGDTVTYSVAVTNTGTGDYTEDDPAFFTDVMEGVLDDAVYNDDVAADTGSASFDDGEVAWSGALASGETATVTYSVTVNDPISGDGTLANAVLGPQESNCPVEMPSGGGGGAALGVSTAIPQMPPGCQVLTPIRSFEVSKTSDTTEAAPGDVVTYTVTVTSTGTAPYTDDVPAGFSDDLSDVLDDATPTGTPAASAGELRYDEPVLEWRGPLEVGGRVTVTYPVQVDDPDEGDGTLVNVVAPTDGTGGRCTSDDDCTTSTAVTPGPDTPAGPGILPRTGPEWIGTLLAIATLLMLGGGLLYRFGSRREE
ncbi:hypothetical protein GCM10009809_19830 [Isoptericola hypogeus]|uniref:Gram-positive cocci surface proteins LPxTG domain-containing protein n=1 Tax=Isoptericola hypogeus TaxID=300179 RepID=A0ABP4VEG8_9MICO